MGFPTSSTASPNDDDDDVDCFPRQDKQPVLPQDISPTNTLPSLIESTTDTPTAPMNFENNNNNDPSTTNTRSDIHASFHTDVPLLVWDGTQYQLDYNHNHRPISTWDGTTHTDIVYDDDDDYNGTNDYAYGDPFNMNDSSNQLQFTQCLKTVQFQKRLQATQQAAPQATTTNTSKHATIKPTNNDPPHIYDTLQLLFLTTHYETRTNDYVDEFPLYTVPHYITRKKHPGHDNYLYRRWNNPTVNKHKTKKTRTKHQRLLFTTIKDDTSVTPTLETLCTQDTRSSNQTDADILISITTWNKPIVQYRMPTRPFASDRKRSRHPSTAVWYALIGVYDKLLNPLKIPCLLSLFTSIISAALSCFILLADSFTMVKIDDRYPDEWND